MCCGSVRDERAHNLELEIIYPKEILAKRPDDKGYHFKLSDIDLGQVIVGKLTFNNIDPNGLTTNELLIDNDMAVRYGVIYLIETNE